MEMTNGGADEEKKSRYFFNSFHGINPLLHNINANDSCYLNYNMSIFY